MIVHGILQVSYAGILLRKLAFTVHANWQISKIIVFIYQLVSLTTSLTQFLYFFPS